MNKNRIFAIVIRHLYIWPRSLERMMWAFGWPFLDLFIWGMVSSYLQEQAKASFSIMTFLLGGIFFWTILWRIQSEISVNLLDEAYNKNLINIFSTPLTWQEFLAALVILGLIKLIFTVASLTLAAYVFYQFNFFAFGLYLPFLFFNIVFFAWIIGFMVNGLILRFGYMIQELAWGIALLIQPFSCVFYPLSSLPVWAQKVARFFPSTYVFEEMRRILATGRANWENLFISFILNLVYMFLVLRFFKVMYESAREHGRLVKLN